MEVSYKLRFVEIPIEKLVKANWNYKNDDVELKEKLKANIKRNGQIENLIVRELETGFFEIVNGNHRYDALFELKTKSVMCYNLGSISLQQAQRIAIETNETRFTSDTDKLSALLNEINIEFEYEDLLSTLPYDADEFKELLEGGSDIDLNFVATEDDFEEADTNTIKTDIVIGDLITFEKDGKELHRLLCGDSTDSDTVAKLMNGEKADMVFTDPPYNVKVNNIVNLGKTKHTEFMMASGEMDRGEFISFLSSAFELLIKFSKAGSIHYICMDWKHIFEIITAGQLFTELKNLCVWNKDNGGMGTFYRSKHELIFVFKNGTAKHINTFELGQHGRYRTNVWDYAGANSFATRERIGNKSIGASDLDMHPTVKPVAMIADAILDCSHNDMLILDLFLGSGTTMVAAHQLHRRCYGMELEPKYCQVITDRMRKLDETLVIKRNGIEI